MPVASNLAPVIPSDYESDNQGYASDYPVIRPATKRTKEELNLSVLQRHNPEISAILSVAPFVTVYDWAPGEEPESEAGWQKTGTVGSLFICQLTPGEYNEERYHGLILNRNGDKNFAFELRQCEDMNIEVNGDFVIVTHHEPEKGMEVNALFIFAEEGKSTAASRAANGELMVELAKAAQRSRVAAEAHAAAQHSHTPRTSYQQLQDIHQSDYSHPASLQQPHPYQHPPPPLPHQPSPAPQIAPQPNRPVDLLALLQGHQLPPDAEPATYHHPPPQPQSSHSNALLEMFRQASHQFPTPPTPGSTNVNDLFRQAGLRLG